MKKILLSVVLTAIVVGVGEYFYLNRQSEGIKIERYQNDMYGYSIDVPESWGAITPYGSFFQEELYDEMETIGPFIPSSAQCEGCYMGIEVFTDKDPNELWVDFYKSLRLIDGLYQEFTVSDSKFPTTIFTFTEEDGSYLSECWLVENLSGDKAYAFCFSGQSIFEDIINSLELK